MSAVKWLFERGYLEERSLEGVLEHTFLAPKRGTDHELPERWLAVAEAAKYLGVSQRTIYDWTKEGRLGAYRTPTGGLLRFRRADLDVCLVLTAPQEPRPITEKEALVLTALWDNEADAVYDTL